jgi:hypothetical protein
LFITAPGAQVYGNRIEANAAGDHAGGILVSNQGQPGVTVEIYENLIAWNTADFTGLPPAGGGVLLAGAIVHLFSNTIVLNSIGNGEGGGIATYYGESMVIERNIIAQTQAGVALHCEGVGTPHIQDNLAWGNLDGDGSGLCADWWLANGNVVADPEFCNPNFDDFTVSADSPALTHPAGPLGAYPLPGCPPVPVVPTTWGRIKSMYVN